MIYLEKMREWFKNIENGLCSTREWFKNIENGLCYILPNFEYPAEAGAVCQWRPYKMESFMWLDRAPPARPAKLSEPVPEIQDWVRVRPNLLRALF